MVQLSYPYMTTGKTLALMMKIFVGKVMSLLFINFSWLSFQGASVFVFHCCSHRPAMVLEPRKIKCITATTFSSFICHEVLGQDATILVFGVFSPYIELQASFFSLLFHLCQVAFYSLCFLPLEWYHLHIWGCYFSPQVWFQVVIRPPQYFTWCSLHRN